MRELPTWRGYTVDRRLRQLRKVPLDAWPEFIDFDSEEGRRLLDEMLASEDGRRLLHEEQRRWEDGN